MAVLRWCQQTGVEWHYIAPGKPTQSAFVESFHRTLLDEHFRVEGRRTWFETIEEMQAVLDDVLVGYKQRPLSRAAT